MKKLYALVIVFIMLFNSAAFYLYFFLQLQNLKTESKALLKQTPFDQLEIITLTTIEYQEALVEEGEIKFNGKMFDIAHSFEDGQEIVLYCRHDKKEDNLLALLDYVVKTPVKSRDSVPETVLYYIGLNYVKPSLLSIDHRYQLLFSSEMPVNTLDIADTFSQEILRPPISVYYFEESTA